MWPLAARAQQPARVPTIGFLGTANPSGWSQWAAVFKQRLHDLGWIEGRNIAIELRWAEGRSERYAEIATEFVRLKVDVIVTTGGAVPAIMQRDSSHPDRSSRRHWTRSAAAWSRAWRGRAATSPGFLYSQSISLVSDFPLLREIVPGLRKLGS